MPGTRFYPFMAPIEQGAIFVTLTLKPKYYKFTAAQQYYKTSGCLRELLRQYGRVQDISGSIVTELTDSGNVHYHLTIKSDINMGDDEPLFAGTKYVAHCLVNDWKKYGLAKITPHVIMTDESRIRTYNYMLKQSELTSRLIPGERTTLHFNCGDSPDIS